MNRAASDFPGNKGFAYRERKGRGGRCKACGYSPFHRTQASRDSFPRQPCPTPTARKCFERTRATLARRPFVELVLATSTYFFIAMFHFSRFAACALKRSSVESSTSIFTILSPFSILFTISCPLVTSPKTLCFPLR